MEKKHLAQEIVKREWVLFDQVHNIGGRAFCQDNWPAFYVMRISQFLAWNKSILISYWNDLTEAEQEGRNPLSEKYGYMMEVTSPEEYDRIKDQLPVCSEGKKKLVEEIVICHMTWMREVSLRYPVLLGKGRPISEETGGWAASFETYLRGELYTYSPKTLQLYHQYIKELKMDGKNLNAMILQNQMSYYGFNSLEEAEARLSQKT